MRHMQSDVDGLLAVSAHPVPPWVTSRRREMIMSRGTAAEGPDGDGPVLATQPPAVQVVDLGEASVEDLLRGAAGGAQSAWNEIVRRYERLVWSVARTYRLSNADAADAVQTTWLRLVEHLGAIRDPDRLGAWLATTTRREALRLATRRRRERADVADDQLAQLPDGGPGVEDSLLATERDRLVNRALGQLDDRCQRLLRVLSMSPPPRYDAVAEAFGMPIGSIGPTRGRCLNRLERSLLACGYLRDDEPLAEASGGRA
jgi:RNA polymerase sigma factor (sigma-70 family)